MEIVMVHPGDRTVTIECDCPAGKKVLGGGFRMPPMDGLTVEESFPLDNDTWRVYMKGEYLGAPLPAEAYAICAYTN